MKKLLSTAVVAILTTTSFQSALAADVGGKVNTRVKTGLILQSNKGIANKNELLLGSITGKNTSVGGNFKSRVKVGAVIQTNTGIANKNRISIGSVTN